MMDEKTSLRKKVIAQMKALGRDEKLTVEEKLMEELFRSELWAEANTIGITISMDFEWDTRPIIIAAWEAGKKIAVPKCRPGNREMDFYEIGSFSHLEVSSFGLEEPSTANCEHTKKEDIDLMVVPGVAFDRRGYRIGFGGGYYDRYLADFQGASLSLCSSFQLYDELPAEPYDVPVDRLIVQQATF